MQDSSSNEFSIERWLAELPEEEIEREMAKLDAEIGALSARKNTLFSALNLKRSFENLYGHAPRQVIDQDGATLAERERITPEPHPGSIRESVLVLMASMPERKHWPVQDLHDGLVRYGWLEASNQAQRSLSAALSRMTALDEIKRVRRGIYARAVPETASPSLLDIGGDSG